MFVVREPWFLHCSSRITTQEGIDMSFLTIGSNKIATGLEAAAKFKALLERVHEVHNSESINHLAALFVVAREPEHQELGEAIIAWTQERVPEKWVGLFMPLRAIEQSSVTSKRQLGWPSASWQKQGAGTAGEVTYGFELDVSGGLSFDVLADGAHVNQHLKTLAGFEAVAKVVAHGGLKGAVNGAIKIPVGGVKASVSGALNRSIEYVYGYQSHDDLAGMALASAMHQLCDPSDGLQLLETFKDPKLAQLHGLLIAGSQGIGGAAQVCAKLPTQYGEFGLELGGEIKTSSAFDLVITAGEGGDALSMVANSGDTRDNAASFGVSYVVGLSTLAPQAAQMLLQEVQAVHQLIVKLDDEINQGLDEVVNTWLKPGDLIKPKVQGLLAQVINDTNIPNGTVLANLARMFGVETQTDTTFEQVSEQIHTQLATVVAQVVDEIPEVFDLDADEISQKLFDTFKDVVDPKVVELLNTNVFAKIKGLVDARVEQLAQDLNAATLEAVERILDRPVADVVQNVKNFMNKVRQISQTVLQKVSQAQTDLLSAEIGWRRSISKAMGMDYQVTFDFSDPASQVQVQEQFKQAVISPRSFGQLVMSQSSHEAITIVDSSARYELNRKAGHRWNVALIGLNLGGAVEKLSKVNIEQTPDGVSIHTAGNISKERSFWNETRRVSFVSAMNLFEASATDVNGQPDPRASATIKINFEETDEKFKLKEAKALLKRFVTSGLLSEDVFDNIIESLAQMHRSADKKHVYATITVGIAIPSDVVIDLLETVDDSQGMGLMAGPSLVQDELIKSLALHDQQWVDANLSQSVTETGFGLTADGAEFAELTPSEQYRKRVEFLQEALDSYALMDERGFGLDADHQANKHVGKAITAFENVLKIGADVFFNLDPPAHDAATMEWERFRSTLRQRQEAMNEQASRYLKTGTPNPIWGNKAPEKTVAMFAALQSVTQRLTQVKPPLMITLKPKTGEPVSFVDF